jgi:hypothetical protein
MKSDFSTLERRVMVLEKQIRQFNEPDPFISHYKPLTDATARRLADEAKWKRNCAEARKVFRCKD